MQFLLFCDTQWFLIGISSFVHPWVTVELLCQCNSPIIINYCKEIYGVSASLQYSSTSAVSDNSKNVWWVTKLLRCFPKNTKYFFFPLFQFFLPLQFLQILKHHLSFHEWWVQTGESILYLAPLKKKKEK